MDAESLHPNCPDLQRHPPKGFSTAFKNYMVVMDEQGGLLWETRYLLPPAINFVDGDSPPPTEIDGDIYVILDSGAVDPDWDGAQDNDWLRYDTSADTWFAITPVEGVRCWDENLNTDREFDGDEWIIRGGGGILTAELLILSADVLQLNSAPFDIVAAPGSGKAIEVISWSTQAIDRAAMAAYDTNTSLRLLTDTAGIFQGIDNTILTSTATRVGRGTQQGTTGAATTQIINNKKLTVTVGTNDPANGNFDIKIFITYRIIKL